MILTTTIDLHAWKGDWPLDTKLPLVGGHEGAGYVVARGDLVTDDQAKIGEAVGLKWLNGSCLACEFCQVSDEQLCGKPYLSGYTVDGKYRDNFSYVALAYSFFQGPSNNMPLARQLMLLISRTVLRSTPLLQFFAVVLPYTAVSRNRTQSQVKQWQL